MSQRYDVPDDLPAGYVEFGDAWSYAELRQVDSLNDADLMAFIARKIIAVDLPTVGGDSISAPGEFADRWQELDARLFHWLLSVSIRERERIGQLGEATLRASLKSYVENQATTKATNAEQGK
jgi:hypothetical protein